LSKYYGWVYYCAKEQSERITMSNSIETRLAPLAAALRTGQLGLPTYIDQLEAQFDAIEERVQAFLPETHRFERLRREAAALEAHYPEPAARPALYGVPVGVKDIFHVEGFPTKAGSRIPPDLLAGPEATSVTQLKQAGALILGKTVTTEFAYFAPGPTRNPYNSAHTPGGSSSGSAAAVGAGLCPLALGTQTIGSIVRPAAFCNVVGFKPSYARISAAGVIPLSTSVDHIGFFTRDVAGAALVAAVLIEDWHDDIETTARPVLGVPEGPYLHKADEEGLAHFEATWQTLAQAGFEIRPVAAMADFEEIYTRHNRLVAAEAAIAHREWFKNFSGLYHPKTVALIEPGQKTPIEEIEAARAGREKLRQELTALMIDQGIDLWMAPSAPGPAPATLDSTGDPIMNLPWTHAGLPSVNVPSGWAKNGLPLGLQLIAGWQEDEKLLSWAAQIAERLDTSLNYKRG
jgi:Asp-tRNA(Asn)/Glu-tRNA(Gln) amidotransferase A subunit family amidase